MPAFNLVSWLKQQLDGPARKHRRSRHFFQPQLMVLEDRVAPAAFTVNTLSDTHAKNLTTGTDSTGFVSLRSAIEAADHLGGSNTISLPAGAYDLSLGQLDIKNNLTLTGMGANNTTINAQFTSRIFQIFSGFTVAISKVTMEKGGVLGVAGSPAQGGVIAQGGAIFDSGALALTNDTLFGNFAVGGAGAAGAPGANGAGGTSTSSPTGGGAGGDGQRGGDAQGGAIFLDKSPGAALSIVNCSITDNEAFQGQGGNGGQGGYGGSTNTSTQFGANGGVGGSGGQGGNAFGGGIYNAGGSLVIQGSVLSGNLAGVSTVSSGPIVGGGSGGVGGSAGFGAGGPSSTGGVGGNGGNGGFAGYDAGGAIYNSSSGFVAITTSSFSQNSAIGETGGQAGAGTSGHDAGFGGGGPGAGGTGGSAGDGSGGAIDNQGTMTIGSSSFFQNQAIGTNGGAGGAGGTGGSSFLNFDGPGGRGGNGGNGGSAGDDSGGAINNQGTMTIDDSSLFENQATGANGGGGPGGAGGTGGIALNESRGGIGGNGGNGGFDGADFAGAIESSMGSLTLTHSTLSLNSAGRGAGGAAGAPGAGGTGPAGNGMSGQPGSNGAPGNAGDGGIQSVSAKSQLFDTIVAGDTAPINPDVNGRFSSLGHNLIGNATGSSGFTAPGDQVGTAAHPIDPMLGPPGSHGGRTPTMVPMVGSPAIDAGDNTKAPSTDQRGLPRIVDGDHNVDDDGPVIDIGAVEFQPTDVSIAAKGSPSSVSPGGTLTYTITVNTGKGDNTITNLALTDTVPAQTTFQSFTAPIGWSVTAPPVGGTGKVTATFGSIGQKATASFTLVVKVSQTAAGSTLTNTSTIATTSPQPTSAGKSATVTTALTPHGSSTAALVGLLSVSSLAASSSTDPAPVKAPATSAVQEVATVTVRAEPSHPDSARRSPAALGRKLHLSGDFWSELDEGGLL